MKSILVSFCFVWVFIACTSGKLHCKIPQPDIPKDWITMSDPCTKKMTDQIQEELTAAMTYLAMGAHFSRDTINRPGLAEYFFKSASEEREHAIKLIDYLLMRGGLTQDISKLIKNPMPDRTNWENAFKAIKHAIMLETHVTDKIRDIISTCESPVTPVGEPFNDYHLVDYLSGEFLEEQYKGQRELAGMASILGKLTEHYGSLVNVSSSSQFLKSKNNLNFNTDCQVHFDVTYQSSGNERTEQKWQLRNHFTVKIHFRKNTGQNLNCSTCHCWTLSYTFRSLMGITAKFLLLIKSWMFIIHAKT